MLILPLSIRPVDRCSLSIVPVGGRPAAACARYRVVFLSTFLKGNLIVNRREGGGGARARADLGYIRAEGRKEDLWKEGRYDTTLCMTRSLETLHRSIFYF